MPAWIEGINTLSAIWAEAMSRVLWQGGLALLTVALVCRLIPRIPAHAQCWLWRLAYVKLFVALWGPAPLELPLLAAGTSDPLPAPPAATLFPAHAALVPAAPGPVSVADGVYSGPVDPGVALCGWGALCWLAVLACWAAHVRRQYRETHRIRSSGVPVRDPIVLRQVRELSLRLGLASTPEVLVTHAARGPFLAGGQQPAIVLPAALVAGGDAEELRLVLAHELGHLKRRDLVWTWLPTLAQGLFPFHPLVWWAQREWSVAVETACDELVLRETAAPPARYARMLLDTATRFGGDTQLRLTTVGVVGSCRSLRRRLQMMHYIRPLSRRRQRLMTAALVAVGAVTLVPWRVVAAPSAPAEVVPAPPPVAAPAAPPHPTPPVGVREKKRARFGRALRPAAAAPAIPAIPAAPVAPAPRRPAPGAAVWPAEPMDAPPIRFAVPVPMVPELVPGAPELVPPSPPVPAAPPVAPERGRRRKARPAPAVGVADSAPAAPALPHGTIPLADPSAPPMMATPNQFPDPSTSQPGVPILKDLPIIGQLFRINPVPPAAVDPAVPQAANRRAPANPLSTGPQSAPAPANPYAAERALRLEAAAESVVEVVLLRHIAVADLQHLLQTGSGLPHGIGRLVSDTRTNSLVVQGADPGLKNLKAGIRLLDVPMRVERGRFRITLSPVNVKGDDLRLHLLELAGAQDAEVKVNADAKSLSLEGSNLWLRQAMALAARMEMGLGASSSPAAPPVAPH